MAKQIVEPIIFLNETLQSIWSWCFFCLFVIVCGRIEGENICVLVRELINRCFCKKFNEAINGS